MYASEKHDVDVNNYIPGPYVYGKMNPANPPFISFSERTATLETNATITFNYTQRLDLDEIVTLTLPNYYTDTSSSTPTQAAISQLMETVQVNLTVIGSAIPQDQQCKVVLQYLNPQSARTIDNATISVPVAQDGISFQPYIYPWS